MGTQKQQELFPPDTGKVYVQPTLYCEGHRNFMRERNGQANKVCLRSPERNGRIVATVFTGSDDAAFIVEACNNFAAYKKEIQDGLGTEATGEKIGQAIVNLRSMQSLFIQTKDILKNLNMFMGLEETTRTLQQSLGMLSDIRGGFIEVAKLFREVESIGNKYAEVIKGQLPRWEASGEYKFEAGEVDDEKYFKRLTRIYSKVANEERLQICIALVKDVKVVLASFRSKSAKLRERVKSLPAKIAGEDGELVPNPEYQQAVVLSQKCDATVKIFEARLKDAYTRFFRYRRTIIKRIIGETERMCELFKGKDALETFDEEFSLDYEHFGIVDQLREVKELDERVTRSRLSIKKGTSYGDRNR